jgi:hypothetical protein
VGFTPRDQQTPSITGKKLSDAKGEEPTRNLTTGQD